MKKQNWTVPRMWEGEDVWIIGGGPSVPIQFGVPQDIIEKVQKGQLPVSAYSEYMKDIHDKHVIGVNMAFLLGDWVDLVVWGDPSFFKTHKAGDLLKDFDGMKVACHQHYNTPEMREQGIVTLRRLKRKIKDKKGQVKNSNDGISEDPTGVYWNGNSGGVAINIAALAGAKRIILVGFDMHSSPSHSHWHNQYGGPKKAPYKTHLGCFRQIHEDAERLGIEIMNASPDSAIPYFNKYRVQDILSNKEPVVVDTNIEKSVGTLTKSQTLKQIHHILKPQFYFEVGVLRGQSLKLSQAPKSVGVDSKPRVSVIKGYEIYKMNSDTYFKKHKPDQKIDLAYIDSSHLIEDVLKDFINIEKHCHKDSVIVMDDVAPAHQVQANRIKQSIKWTGDVWKIVPILRRYRPDLDVKLLDTAPTGMLVVRNLDPSNLTLENNYNDILKDWKEAFFDFEVLERKGAYTNLDFLGEEEIRVGIVTPTCSPERAEFLEFLEDTIKKQTKQPYKWIKVDFQKENGQPDIAKRIKHGVKQAFEEGCNFVLFMEDDDYYPLTYVEAMVDKWKENGYPTIIGVQNTLYYHLKARKFHEFHRKDHCSLFCTGVGKNVEMQRISDNAKMVDVKLWKQNPGVFVELEDGTKPIGIKHGLGQSGGSFHDPKRFTQNNGYRLEDFMDEGALDFYLEMSSKI